MKKLCTFSLLALVLTLLTGCATITISEPGSLSGIEIEGATTPADRAVIISNTGMYLFWNITLGSGDLRWDDKKQNIKGGTAFFGDYVGASDIYEVLCRIAERENCDIVDVTFMNRSDSDLQLMSYQGLAMGLLGTANVTLSAILRAKEQPKTQEVMTK